mmetsp:Transcript_9873/g.32335  ORF Transcript_9873/g.32335 Transcript_9873/m.32335 type:complete len:316 (-) Transcript_9873:1893-2840(-)
MSRLRRRWQNSEKLQRPSLLWSHASNMRLSSACVKSRWSASPTRRSSSQQSVPSRFLSVWRKASLSSLISAVRRLPMLFMMERRPPALRWSYDAGMSIEANSLKLTVRFPDGSYLRMSFSKSAPERRMLKRPSASANSSYVISPEPSRSKCLKAKRSSPPPPRHACRILSSISFSVSSVFIRIGKLGSAGVRGTTSRSESASSSALGLSLSRSRNRSSSCAWYSALTSRASVWAPTNLLPPPLLERASAAASAASPGYTADFRASVLAVSTGTYAAAAASSSYAPAARERLSRSVSMPAPVVSSSARSAVSARVG